MLKGPFDPSFAELPGVLAVFPLAGVLLLPGGRLPLNIFEPRYLNMTRDAMGAAGGGARMIGMVQPTGAGETATGPALYRRGCAGRITSFAETEDGRYLITLTGVCRFNLGEELPLKDGYRRVIPDFRPFRRDLEEPAEEEDEAADIDRTRLIKLLEGYFKARDIAVDWATIENMPDDELVTTLAMICPFDAGEKQALLEAADLARRAGVLIACLEMAGREAEGGAEITRH